MAVNRTLDLLRLNGRRSKPLTLTAACAVRRAHSAEARPLYSINNFLPLIDFTSEIWSAAAREGRRNEDPTINLARQVRRRGLGL